MSGMTVADSGVRAGRGGPGPVGRTQGKGNWWGLVIERTVDDMSYEAKNPVQATRRSLDVVETLRDWDRDTWFDETGLPWVQPSPNMPTPTTALVYPGTCFFVDDLAGGEYLRKTVDDAKRDVDPLAMVESIEAS
jgi:hypothetical protein